MMSKLVNINSGIGSSLIATKSYIDSKVEIDGFMDIAKISKLVKILINNDINKIKEIIECDIDKELSANLIIDNYLDDSYLLEIFTTYLKSSDMDEKLFKLLMAIISKLNTKKSLSKCKKVLEDNLLKNKSYIENLINELDIVNSKIINSVDYVLED